MRKHGWGLLLACGLAVGMASGGARAQVDLAPFLKREGFERVKISPDGQYYAATMPMEDREALIVLRRSDKKPVSKIVGDTGSAIEDFWWANDERVVVAAAERFGSRDKPYATGQLYAVGVNGERVKSLLQEEVSNSMVQGVDGTPYRFGRFLATTPGDPRSILVSESDYDTFDQTHVERINLYNGVRTPVSAAPVRSATFTMDGLGNVRTALGHVKNDNFSKLYYRDNADADWRLVNDEAVSGHVETPLGFSADGVTAYLQVERAKGPDIVVAWNTRTGERHELFTDETVDPLRAVRDVDGRTVVGVQYVSDRLHTRFFDEKSPIARIYRSLEHAMPDLGITITSFTRDGKLALAVAWNDRTPGDVYLYDTATKSAQGVIAARSWLDPEQMAPTRAVDLVARDGTPLHGYLTVPPGAPSQPMPLVVLPHGGPFYVFDAPEFDDDSQILASAGYAVLRVNFRGSGNYGRSFSQAGARQWGGAMQDDLTDATRWAIAQKLADPARICIYGASYGGYAALMGVAREPTLYRCAIGYVGVYDLVATRSETRRDSRSLAIWADDWIGEKDTLAARSPTTLAGRIKVPVFLAAGGRDERAPIAQSRKMERALRDAHVPVETLYVDSEGHGFYTEEHQRAFYTQLLDFLARNIGGQRAGVAGVAGTQ